MADNEQRSSQSGAAQDPFEMFRRLWAPLGLPVPGMAMPTLDPAEVEKRISDLKSVETWLGMNLNMVKMAIQGLEVQKMALSAMQANAGAASEAANAFANFSHPAPAGAQAGSAENAADKAGHGADPASAMANPLLWPWAMMQGVTMPGATPAKPAGESVDRAASPGKRKSRDGEEKK